MYVLHTIISQSHYIWLEDDVLYLDTSEFVSTALSPWSKLVSTALGTVSISNSDTGSSPGAETVDGDTCKSRFTLSEPSDVKLDDRSLSTSLALSGTLDSSGEINSSLVALDVFYYQLVPVVKMAQQLFAIQMVLSPVYQQGKVSVDQNEQPTDVVDPDNTEFYK